MATDLATAQEQNEAYAYYRDNGHLDFLSKARECENFFAGRQWDSALKARLERRKLPAMTINKTMSAMMSIMGEQVNSRADVTFRPSESGTPEVAAALDKLHLHIANDNKLDFVESTVFDDAIITGRGFYDIRMNFDRNIRGEIAITADNPLNIMVDPDAEEYDPTSWSGVINSRWYSGNNIIGTFGQDAYDELKNRPQSSMGYDFIDERFHSFAGRTRTALNGDDNPEAMHRRYRVVERQHMQHKVVPHFVDLQTGETAPIPSDWARDKIAKVRQHTGFEVIKRAARIVYWTVTVDDLVLHDGESPYRYFTVVPYFPIFRRGATLGFVEGQIDPQSMYNKTLSQMFHIVNTTANSGWKLKAGSLQNMTADELESRGAETGLVMELDDVNNAEKIQPNQVPTGLDRLGYLLAEDLKEVSMVPDSARGFDRADVAAKAIMAKKAASSGNFAKALTNLQFSRQLLAERELDLIQRFYTEERTYRITGGGLQPEQEQLTINQATPEGEIINDVTLGEYSVIITPAPARSDFEETQFQEAVQLRELGIALPDHVVIEHSHLNRKAELAEQVKQRTGWGDPSEMDQQMQQLEQQLKQLEAEKVAAENKRIESETALNLVRAQQTANEDSDDEAMLAQQEMKRQEILANVQLKQYEIDQQIALKREELQQTMELKRQELADKAALARAEAAQRIADARKREAASAPPAVEKSETPTERKEAENG